MFRIEVFVDLDVDLLAIDEFRTGSALGGSTSSPLSASFPSELRQIQAIECRAASRKIVGVRHQVDDLSNISSRIHDGTERVPGRGAGNGNTARTVAGSERAAIGFHIAKHAIAPQSAGVRRAIRIVGRCYRVT